MENETKTVNGNDGPEIIDATEPFRLLLTAQMKTAQANELMRTSIALVTRADELYASAAEMQKKAREACKSAVSNAVDASALEALGKMKES